MCLSNERTDVKNELPKNERDRAIVSNPLFAETIIEKHRLQYLQ